MLWFGDYLYLPINTLTNPLGIPIQAIQLFSIFFSQSKIVKSVEFGAGQKRNGGWPTYGLVINKIYILCLHMLTYYSSSCLGPTQILQQLIKLIMILLCNSCELDVTCGHKNAGLF